MKKAIYMLQTSKDECFTSIYYTKVYSNKKEALRGYEDNKEILENKLHSNDYLRLIKIEMFFGVGNDRDGETIIKNF